MWSRIAIVAAFALLVALLPLSTARATSLQTGPMMSLAPAENDLIFIHHSVGANWLNAGLELSLLAKPYIDERNDIYYGSALTPRPGRPASLGAVPGDWTDMHHWILWFNDYLQGVKAHGSSSGFNHIILFKSCYPNSDIVAAGVEPGNPFSAERTLANYRAVFRHPAGPGQTYTREGYSYQPLEEIFAANPDVLFIPVTAPPLHYAPGDATNDANAHRARLFNNWLKNEWLPAYNAAHPGLNNVAVFDLFDALAYPDNDPQHPNRLRQAYGGATGDSHPNEAGSDAATALFAAEGTFLDQAWAAFVGEEVERPWRQYIPLCTRNLLGGGPGFVNGLFEVVHLRPPWLFCY